MLGLDAPVRLYFTPSNASWLTRSKSFTV